MYETVIISDVHVGSGHCESQSILSFLSYIKDKTAKLIINGDLFESFDSYLNRSHWKILGKIKEISNDIEVIWVKGNHDTTTEASMVSDLLGTNFHKNDYIFESGGKNILVIHGDSFDKFLAKHPILVTIADWIYEILQKLPIGRFTHFLKHKAKKYLRCHEKVEMGAKSYAKSKNCDLVCCGHVHYAEIKDNYYNSGCWTEKEVSYLTVKEGNITLEWWKPFYNNI